VLFDEIEKGHPDVFHTLLQILDDGRLTDGQGRTVSFKNTVIVMTSNVGTGMVERNTIGFSVHAKNSRTADTQKRLLEALRSQFRPEFLNRVDEIVTFQRLTEEQLTEVIELQTGGLRKRLAERRIALDMTDEAKRLLVERGYDPAFGARPLKRTVQREVENPLALRVLSGELGEGDTVVVDAEDGVVVLTVRRREPAGIAE
jgi:ATP-dependent Clp protease ATP-binding subunit ClpB